MCVCLQRQSLQIMNVRMWSMYVYGGVKKFYVYVLGIECISSFYTLCKVPVKALRFPLKGL